MTRKRQLCERAAEILRNADYCCGRQFVAIFGQDLHNCHQHSIGKASDHGYRIDNRVYSQSLAMSVVKGFLGKGAYTLSDLDYLNLVAAIVDGNTSPSGLDFWGVDASYDCENHIEFLTGIGKTTNDLFNDALEFAERQGSGLVM